MPSVAPLSADLLSTNDRTRSVAPAEPRSTHSLYTNDSARQTQGHTTFAGLPQRANNERLRGFRNTPAASNHHAGARSLAYRPTLPQGPASKQQQERTGPSVFVKIEVFIQEIKQSRANVWTYKEAISHSSGTDGFYESDLLDLQQPLLAFVLERYPELDVRHPVLIDNYYDHFFFSGFQEDGWHPRRVSTAALESTSLQGKLLPFESKKTNGRVVYKFDIMIQTMASTRSSKCTSTAASTQLVPSVIEKSPVSPEPSPSTSVSSLNEVIYIKEEKASWNERASTSFLRNEC